MQFAEALLENAGVAIDGTNSWDIQVYDNRLYDRVFSRGSLGLGEAYMDGWWDAEALDEFFYKILRTDIAETFRFSPEVIWTAIYTRLLNAQKYRAFRIGEHHYDIGNELYEAMLDKRMTYTCGYWKDVETLDEAQEAKLDLVCRKLGLKSGQRVLDIGSGWGSFLNFAAERYGVEGVGVTVSKEQAEYANTLSGTLPVETRLADYRTLEGQFDHIVSIGMFEHVGYKNYRSFMKKAASLLSDDGLFLLHTIGSNKSVTGADPWIARYIFPDGMLPSIAQIGTAIEQCFVMEDWHTFGSHYDTTLMHWFRNFDAAWPRFSVRYGQRFYRMWKYYLLSCAGSFRARKMQLWQIVLSKHGVDGGYSSVR